MITEEEAKSRLINAAELLCDELEMSMPDKPQEFEGENIWNAQVKLRQALATLSHDTVDRADIGHEGEPG